MNVFNRLVMIFAAILLIGIPIVILLTTFGVIPSGSLDSLFGYSRGLDSVARLSRADIDRVYIITGIICGIIALIALAIIFRELIFRVRRTRKVIVQDDPGSEVVVTPDAVRHLVQGAVRESGAISPKVRLASHKNVYDVDCELLAPDSDHLTEVAQRARDSIQVVLHSQSVQFRTINITVNGTASTTSSSLS